MHNVEHALLGMGMIGLLVAILRAHRGRIPAAYAHFAFAIALGDAAVALGGMPASAVAGIAGLAAVFGLAALIMARRSTRADSSVHADSRPSSPRSQP